MAKQEKYKHKILLDDATPATALYGPNREYLRLIRSLLPRTDVIGTQDAIYVSAYKMNDANFSANAVTGVLSHYKEITKNNPSAELSPADIRQTIDLSLTNDNNTLKGATMTKPETTLTTTIKTAQSNETNAFMNQKQNGWLHKRLQKDFDVTVTSFKTKVHLTSKTDLPESKIKRINAERIARETITVQKAGNEMTEDYYNELASGAPTRPEMSVSKEVTNRQASQHPRRIEVVLPNKTVASSMFNNNTNDGIAKHVKMLRAIFQVDITLNKGTPVVSIKPSGKLVDDPEEADRETLRVSQTANVLTGLATASVSNEIIGDKGFGILVMTAVKGAENEEKTLSKLFKQYGRDLFPELAGFASEEETEETHPEEAHTPVAAPKNDKNHRTINTIGDFGDKFIQDSEVEAMFRNKLGMELAYYGRDNKRLTVTRKQKAASTLDQAERVIAYTQMQYAEAQNTIQPALIANAIDNVLHGREVDFIAPDRREDLDKGKRKEQNRMSTFNRKGTMNQYVYPDGESQYEARQVILGKPSNDPERTFKEEAARITILIAAAGAGKTFVGVAAGVHVYNQGWAKNVYFLRPQIGTNGKPPPLIPGDMKMKSASALAPIYENLEIVMPNDIAAKHVREPIPPGAQIQTQAGQGPVDPNRKIEIGDAAMYRGRTITGYAYVDEAQNLTADEGKMMMTRIGKNSHMVMSIDLSQIDVKPSENSFGPAIVIALYEAKQRGSNKYIQGVVMNGNKRDAVVDEALDMWHAFETNGAELKREDRVYTWENQYDKALEITYGTSDREEVARIREADKKKAKAMGANVVNFQDAKNDITMARMAKTMAVEMIKEMVNQGVIQVAKPA